METGYFSTEVKRSVASHEGENYPVSISVARRDIIALQGPVKRDNKRSNSQFV